MRSTDERGHRAAPPTIAGTICLALGALGLFATVVGFGLSDGRLSGWDRLEAGRSFGLPSPVVGLIGLALVVAGLVLLGVGIGAAREHHSGPRHHGHHPHPLH